MPFSPERQVIALLRDVLTEEQAWDWLYSPSLLLGGELPANLLARGELPRVLAAAQLTREGAKLET